MKNTEEKVISPLEPIWDPESRIIILGTMPSVASRKERFYYAHPRNRFWPVMEALDGQKLPDREARIAFLHRRHLALWDVVASCLITGSSDASIHDVVVNDFSELIHKTKIRRIVTTGKTAGKLYKRYAEQQTGIPALVLPSTSAANASVSIEELIEAYRILLEEEDRGSLKEE